MRYFVKDNRHQDGKSPQGDLLDGVYQIFSLNRYFNMNTASPEKLKLAIETWNNGMSTME
jgi:hypothetical protein